VRTARKLAREAGGELTIHYARGGVQRQHSYGAG